MLVIRWPTMQVLLMEVFAMVIKIGFKSQVEVGAALDDGKAVGICEFGEDTDVAAFFF